MTPKDLPELTGVQAFQNTDREVWRETPGDSYSNSVHLTATGGLGINVGGTVHVKPPAEWHRLASGARSTAAQPLTLSHEEIDRVFNEHEEAPQISYRYWVANALLAAANEKSPTAAAKPVEPTLRSAALALISKMDALKPHMDAMCLDSHNRGRPYKGPTYGIELEALRAAASGDSTPPSAPVQGDSTERSGEKPEAVDRERGVR